MIYKIDAHIAVTRDDGNFDAIMAEDFTLLESEDHKDGEKVSSSNGLGDAIAKAWNLWAPKLHHDYSITAWALSVYLEVYEDAKQRLRRALGGN